MGFFDGVGDIMTFIARTKSGDLYKRGFDDARAGSGKDPAIIRMRGHINNSSIADSMRQAARMGVDAYEEGYRDGMERERLDKIAQFRGRLLDDI